MSQYSHQTSQRFAVGTIDATILVYDLRTATKWRVLDATDGAIAAIAFDKSGDRVVSYSAQGKSLRVWTNKSPGMFGGLLTLRGTCLVQLPLDLLEVQPTESCILKDCRLEWTAPAEVRLRREGGGDYISMTLPLE